MTYPVCGSERHTDGEPKRFLVAAHLCMPWRHEWMDALQLQSSLTNPHAGSNDHGVLPVRARSFFFEYLIWESVTLEERVWGTGSVALRSLTMWNVRKTVEWNHCLPINQRGANWGGLNGKHWLWWRYLVRNNNKKTQHRSRTYWRSCVSLLRRHLQIPPGRIWRNLQGKRMSGLLLIVSAAINIVQICSLKKKTEKGLTFRRSRLW